MKKIQYFFLTVYVPSVGAVRFWRKFEAEGAKNKLLAIECWNADKKFIRHR
jgi:hypothetical protein